MPGLSASQKRQKEKDKKRRKKEIEQIEREHSLHDATKGSAGQRKAVELNEVATALRKLGRTIKEVPGDGNCLFYALIDQLEVQMTAEDLRRRIADHMMAHAEDYSPFVLEEDAVSTGDRLQRYCESLKTSAAHWGSMLEVRAAADIFSAKIYVVKSNGVIEIGPPASERSIVIAYLEHQYALGAHFNSTKVIEEGAATPL